MKPLIIIGTGLAGYTVARELRKLGNTTPIILMTADDGGFYSKPMLSNAFAQDKEARQLVTQSAAQMAAQLGATILTRTRVGHLDAAGKTVTAGNATFEYDRLVLALGAQPIRLALGGDAAHQVVSVNHVDDYALLRSRIAALGRPARVAILGAGLIGCEFADDLAGAGHQVTLVDPNTLPLSALAAPSLSRGLHAALSARGVAFRCGTTAAGVDQVSAALRVSLADGTSIDADLVLSAVGLRPDLALAQAAGLKTARGIVVDTYGQTSAPGIYALGDCAEYSDAHGSRVMPYIAPLMTAARAIARTIHGQPTHIDLKPAPVVVKTPSYPLALLPPPLPAVTGGEWHTTQNGSSAICRFYDRQGIMLGFGVAPQDASVRLQLLGELGKRAQHAA
ncbi:FAD-dependent oxidoreductase [Noviherbaspirillum sp. UKPF54]|uniref:FAD-dependent oxidoreductase n=1 Tax=Noviherbaspirillum sp. UKPF54 TaxID=2601898 RepID=UPI0011B111B7|nr:FAD-dependent oxidoreductase [Noviherbaspirillum sp. UKPF54]QDZ28677.1 FAD-dependent oxidoreductase [Noviherbaspirillum sp. UKPF54]